MNLQEMKRAYYHRGWKGFHAYLGQENISMSLVEMAVLAHENDFRFKGEYEKSFSTGEDLLLVECYYQQKLPWKIIIDKFREEGYDRNLNSLIARTDSIGLGKRSTIRFFTPREDEIMREHYEKVGARHTARELVKAGFTDRTPRACQARAFKLRLRSPLNQATREVSERICCNRVYFTKGSPSLTRGKKMTAAQYEKCKATMFKKGCAPSTTQYAGAIRPRMDKRTGRVYLYYCLEQGKWEPIHRVAWMRHKGAIPEKHIIVFTTGEAHFWHPKNPELFTIIMQLGRRYNAKLPGELKEKLDSISLEELLPHLECISMKENAKRNRNENSKRLKRERLDDSVVMSYAKTYIGNEWAQTLYQWPEAMEMMRKHIELMREINAVKS